MGTNFNNFVLENYTFHPLKILLILLRVLLLYGSEVPRSSWALDLGPTAWPTSPISFYSILINYKPKFHHLTIARQNVPK